MRRSWKTRSTSSENAPESFSPEAMSISTPCRGWKRGRDIAPMSGRRSAPSLSRLFFADMGSIRWIEIEPSNMKTLSLITAAFFLLFGAVPSRGAVLTRISDETGVPVDTLQAERASTGLGYGELENAHLLANGLAANGSRLT